MVRSVRLDSAMASAAARRSPVTRVRSLASIATSVPVPIAIPRSACARAAASLTPSPTIATTRPRSCRRRTTSTLSHGSTSAITSSMPISAATVRAARSLSPVSSTGDRPSARSSAMARALEGFTVSATTSMPRTRPSQATAIGVWPAAWASDCAVSRSFGSSADHSCASHPDRPAATACPSTTPITPRPGTFRNDSTPGREPTRSRAPPAIAAATGCSEACSNAPASRSSTSGSTPSPGTTSTRVIRPVVTVPVLSTTTVSTRRVDSNTCGPLTKIPSWAALPVPTRRAVGVARPNAQGQAMINTETAAVNANAAPAPASSHPTRVSNARATTMGTNTADTRSARRCTGALPACASATRRAIWASWVSDPIRVARTTSRPPALTVAPTTSSPGPTSTGTGSPVSMLVSTADAPSSTTPSVAIFSPGRTTNRSPTARSLIGRRTSTPSRRIATSLAPMPSSARNAAPERDLTRASR